MGLCLNFAVMVLGKGCSLVYRKNSIPEILVGGFYHKSGGSSQKEAIQNARKRINAYEEET